MPAIDLLPEHYQPSPPDRKDWGIGIVGCGNIARNAHLPAYRSAGYRVTACCDVNPEALRAAQQEFGVPFATTRVEELVARPDVEIIDLAVPAVVRREVMERIAPAGKPVLSQKPFAMNFADAEAMVRLCERHGAVLMVNQQARWAPAHRAVRVLLDRGVLGHVYSVLMLNRSFQDTPGTWYANLRDFNIVDHGIHYLDLTRYFTGLTPLRVHAATTFVPGQAAVSPMIFTASLAYAPEAALTAAVHFNNIAPARALHRYEWFIDGTEGSIAASHAELSLAFRSEPDEKGVLNLRGRWFPDAFMGSMGELMRSLAEGRPPQTSGRDNLESLRLAFAAVASSERGAAVDLAAVGASPGEAAHEA